MIPEKVVERLISYHSILKRAIADGVTNLYSHQIAELMDASPAQVRRDVMEVGYNGSPKNGYAAEELQKKIEQVLALNETTKIVLVGVGNLGRAILHYFFNQRPRFEIVGAFDIDPGKVGRVISGCRCYPMAQLGEIATPQNAQIGVIAVPATDAQKTADALLKSGVKSLINFAPIRLSVARWVHVEYVDMTMLFEKASYFSRSAQ